MAAFRKSLQKFVSMLSPPADLDDAVKQLDDDLSALDRHAPLRTRKRRQEKITVGYLPRQWLPNSIVDDWKEDFLVRSPSKTSVRTVGLVAARTKSSPHLEPRTFATKLQV